MIISWYIIIVTLIKYMFHLVKVATLVLIVATFIFVCLYKSG